MSEWTTPKIDWTADDRFNIGDYNRIKNNLDYLYEKSQEIYGEYVIADMGEDLNSYTGYWDVDTFNKFESNLETINQHMVDAEIGYKQTFYANGVFIGYAELNRIENALLTLKAVVDGWYEGMRVLSFRLGTSPIGSDKAMRIDRVIDIELVGEENVGGAINVPLDLSPLSVIGILANGETKDITNDCVFNPASGTVFTEIGTQTITVTYTEHSTTFTESFDIEINIVKIVSWANGTDAELKAMLTAHYNGDIDIYDYWDIGDERIVSVSTVDPLTYTYDGNTYSSPSFSPKNQKMVLVNKGGRYYETQTSYYNECAFIVMMLSDNSSESYYYEIAQMFRNVTTQDAYDNMIPYGEPTISSKYSRDLYRWVSERLFYALPPTFRSMFKNIVAPRIQEKANDTYDSVDTIGTWIKFILPTEYEIMGSNSAGITRDETEYNNPFYPRLNDTIIQFEYFQNGDPRHDISLACMWLDNMIQDSSDESLQWAQLLNTGSSSPYIRARSMPATTDLYAMACPYGVI